MAIASNFPAIRPSLNLDFANAKALDPRITFSRASAATYYDGKTVAKAEENLFTSSDGPLQTALNGAVYNGDGTISFSAATNYSYKIASKIIDVGVKFTVSVLLSGSGIVRFGALSGNGGNLGVYTPISLTATPTKYSFTVFNTVSGSSCGFQILGASDGFAATVKIEKYQFEIRDQATAYTPTTTQPITNYIPVLQTAPAGVPRFDHNPVTGESLGLLVEEQRTNLLTSSEQFSNAVWTKTAEGVGIVPIVSANSHMAPDGTLSADEIILDVGSGSTAVDRSSVMQATNLQLVDHAYSLYIKPTGSTVIDDICTESGAVSGINFVIAHNGAVVTLRRKALGNGWFRLESSTSVITASGSFRIQLLGTSAKKKISFACWGAQLEAGAFPTSYIKTEASQATRAPDSAQMTGANFSFWYSQVEGTLLVEARNTIGATVFSTAVLTDDQDLQTNNRLALFNRPNGVSGPAALVTYNGSEQITNGFSFKENNKIAVAYKNNDVTAALNGATSSQDTSANISAFTKLRIGQLSAGSYFFATQTIKRLIYYPKALPSSLQALTA